MRLKWTRKISTPDAGGPILPEMNMRPFTLLSLLLAATPALASAPRSADGSTIICDARCLRALAGRPAGTDR